MNDVVLFYLQPHTIRNNAKTFEWVFKKYYALAQGMEKLGLASIFMVDDQVKRDNPAPGGRVYSPADFGVRFDTSQWPAYWRDILTNPDIPEKRRLLEALYQKSPFQWAFCWGYDAALDRFCRDKGCTLVFQELGMIRRPMLYQMDLSGLLWKSSLVRLFNKYQAGLKPDRARLEHFLSVMRTQPSADREEIIRGLKLDAAKPIVLILLQVEDDSNIVVGSPFGSMQAYVDYCFSNILDIREYNVIIRKHPGQAGVAVSLDRCQAAGIKPWLVLHEYDNLSLIQAADYIFTINSSAGFEGLCYGKKVVTFGRSPYHEAGFTLNLDADKEYVLREAAAFFDGLFEEKREQLEAFLDFSLFRYHFPEHLMFLPEYYGAIIGTMKQNQDKEVLYLREADESPGVLKAALSHYTDRLDRQESELGRQAVHVRALEREKARLETALQSVSVEMNRQAARAEELERTMNASRIWRLSRHYYALRDRFLPGGSGRGKKADQP